MILLRVQTTYSLVSSVFLSIVDAILKIWCPAWSRVALQEHQGPDVVHLFPLLPGRLSLVMLCPIKRQRGPVEMAAGMASAATGGGDGGRSYHFLRQLPCHYYHISDLWAASVAGFRSDQMVRGTALRLRASPFCADALPSSELLSCSIVFKYVGPPQPLLSFPSSCSRLFDNRGKWVLKRQLIEALSGVELRRDWGSWLHYPLIVPPKIRTSIVLVIYHTGGFPSVICRLFFPYNKKKYNYSFPF